MIHVNDRKPGGIFPFITIAVIVLNCLVLLYGLSLGPRFEAFVYRFGLIPYEVTRGRQVIFVCRHLVRDERTGDLQVMAEVSEEGFPDARSVLKEAYFPILSSMFLHANLLHLAGNMVFLWLFGPRIENYLGHLRFLWFYLLCGIMASFCHIASNGGSEVPTIGASGSISGILGACLLLYPNYRVFRSLPFFYFIRIGAVPAFFLIGMWFIGLVIYSIAGCSVAWFAHIGGFVGGLLLILILRPRKGLRRRIRYFV
ncbi:MAG: rhomboid family intramembrane serine protease [Candidatus Tritonobacter lacicola]|nr:rhomboid family intramembrane serine protease [Candidatus Tritonobacter lacicola]